MESSYKHSVVMAVIAGGIAVVLTVFVFVHYRSSAGKIGTIEMPFRNTYLGTETSSASGELTQSDKFTVAGDIPWHTVRGSIYPYTISVPNTLSLVTFPNNIYDIYAISWRGIPPSSNVLIGVDDVQNDVTRAHFASDPAINYVQEWWKQFGLKGVSSISEFTNSQGLVGYRAKYIDNAGNTPNDDVFFRIPGNPRYVIHLASGVLESGVFDKIVDSVSWKNQ